MVTSLGNAFSEEGCLPDWLIYKKSRCTVHVRHQMFNTNTVIASGGAGPGPTQALAQAS